MAEESTEETGNVTDPAQQDQGPDAGATPPEPTEVEQLKAQVEKWKTLSRKNEHQAKSNKTSADSQSELLKKVSAALGLDADGSPADPDAVAQQIQAKDAVIRDLQVRNGLTEVITGLKADPVLTRAVMADTGALKDLDPTASDFTEQLTEAVGEILKKHPKLLLDTTAAPPPESGAEKHNGGTDKTRPTSLAEAVGGHYKT